MRNTFALSTVLTLLTVSLTAAFDGLEVPSTIVANTTSLLRISNDLSNGASSFDGVFSNFRTYLSLSVPGHGSGPACYLVNSTITNTTSLSFLIPASVGPDGSYSIATMEFNQDAFDLGRSSYEYSNEFELTNATGSWSAAELAGRPVGNPDKVPCSAYNCARNCTQSFYPLNVNQSDALRATWDCTAACPGATYESWAALYEEFCVDARDAGKDSASSICAGASSASVVASIASVSATASHSATTTSNGFSTFSATSSAAKPTKSSGAGSQVSPVKATLFSTVLGSLLAVLSIS